MTNSMKGLDPKALPPKLVDGLNQIVDTAYKDSFGDWHITADEGRVRKLCKAAAAALSALPEPGAEAEGVQPVGWQGVAPDGRCDFTRNKATADDWIRKDWFIRPLYASPAFPTPASPKTRVKLLEWCETITLGDLRGGSHSYAGSILGNYKVWGDGSWSDPYNFHVAYPNWRPELLTLDAAKAAAQSDYEARILSALTPEAEKGDGWQTMETAPKDGVE